MGNIIGGRTVLTVQLDTGLAGRLRDWRAVTGEPVSQLLVRLAERYLDSDEAAAALAEGLGRLNSRLGGQGGTDATAVPGPQRPAVDGRLDR